MKILRISALAILLSGCAPEQELWNRPGGWTQTVLDQDYAACQLMALQAPEQRTQVEVYTTHVTTIGNQTMVTTGPDPYAQLGASIGDSIDNSERQTAIRRWCMQSKGYVFAGTRPAPQ